MFQHILVPLDGSTRAEQALPIAARIARFSGGTLTLLRVVMPPLYVDVLSPQPVLRGVMVEESAAAKDYLTHLLTAECLEGMNVNMEVRVDMPAQKILEVTQTQQVDLIVMCSHGNGLTRWILGSVAQKVVRHSLVPVFVLHEETLAPLAQPDTLPRPLRVLVGLDGSPFAGKALVPAAYLCAALAAPAQGALHLTRVLPTLSGLRSGQELYDGKEAVDAMYALTMSDARASLNDMERRLREPDLAPLNLQVTSSILDRDDVAYTLRKAAESGKYIKDDIEGFDGCDIIALATHGRSGLRRLVLGSVTEYILETTKLPLLIVRPVEQATQVQETIPEKERAKRTPQEEYAIRIGLS